MSRYTWFLGVDPGKSGGFALLHLNGTLPKVWKMPGTVQDLVDLCGEIRSLTVGEGWSLLTMLEKVHAMPGQGVTSMFNFGRNVGQIETALHAAELLPLQTVTPQKWQGALGCLTKGDKNVTKAKAQALFPGLKVTHAVADASLLAWYARDLYERPSTGVVQESA